MMSYETLLTGLAVVSGLIIIHYTLQALDGMSWRTDHGIRLAFILMAAGGFVQLIGPFIEEDISAWGNVLLPVSVAMLFIFDRRTTVCKRALITSIARRERFTKGLGGA